MISGGSHRHAVRFVHNHDLIVTIDKYGIFRWIRFRRDLLPVRGALADRWHGTGRAVIGGWRP